MATEEQGLPRLDSQMVFPATGLITRPWHRFLIALWIRSGGGSGYDIATLIDQTNEAFLNEIADTPPDLMAFQDASLLGSINADEARELLDVISVFGLVPDDAGDKPVAAVRSVTVGGSPVTFTAMADGNLLISGGTVTGLSLVRGLVTTTLPVALSMVPLSAGDTASVTYGVAPTITFIPR